MRFRGLPAILLSIPFATTACVEANVHEQTQHKLAEVERTLSSREAESRAYQWQVGTLAQQLRESQQRTDALQRELHAQIKELAATNAALAERLKKLEGERAALILATSNEAAAQARDGKAAVRPEDLRRMLAAADARNAAILDTLLRMERLMGAPAASPKTPGEAAPPGRLGPPADVIDPWGFGSRK